MTKATTKPLRIVSLLAENIKRLMAVNITPDGNVVQITGKNRQGKTSVLDSIWWAIEGKSNIQRSPIRRGAEQARIRLDLGEIIVTRKFAAQEDGGYTTSISVETPEGASFKSPQTLLDDIVGELSFDPLAFAEMDDKMQFDALKTFVVDVDISKLDALNRGDFERRTDVNRELDRARAAAAGISWVGDSPPASRVDEQELVERMSNAADENMETQRRQGNRSRAVELIEQSRKAAEAAVTRIGPLQDELNEKRRTEIQAAEEQIAALHRRIIEIEATHTKDRQGIEDKCKGEAAEYVKNADGLQAQLDSADPLPPITDTAAIAAQLNSAKEGNRLLDAWEQDGDRKAEHLHQADTLAATSDELTAKIAERTQQKQAAIAKAHLPVSGLGFGDGFVTLNGQPFDQASDAEQLEAAVAIAAALNPKLRVIRIRDGSRLDADAMVRLEQIAERLDFQIWIERVDGSGKVGFVIEDGHLKADDSKADAA